MTCIAWDGTTLAGDRLADYGGTPLRVRKVHKLIDRDGKDWLVGYCGNWNFSRAWIAWLTGARTEKPVLTTGDLFTALMIDRQRRVWQVESYLQPSRVGMIGGVHSIGSGRGEAIGAMVMGASARKAVEIAARYNTGVGLGVDVVRF